MPLGAVVELTVLGTTDLHGHVHPTTYLGDAASEPVGLARVATLVKQLRREHPHVLLVDSGDTLQGSPMTDWFVKRGGWQAHTNPMIAAMNHLGYDAWALGNHDFNYGLEVLEKARRDAIFPVLAANVTRAGSDEPAFQPYVLRDVGPVRVAIIGAVTPGVTIWDRPHVEGRLDFGDIVAAFRRYVPEVRGRGADLVIAAIHSGLGGDGLHGPTFTGYGPETGLPPENVGLALAEQVPGIDVVLAGHSHKAVEGLEAHGVLFAQAEKWGSHLAVVELQLERTAQGFSVKTRRSRCLPTGEVEPEPELLTLLDAVHRGTQAYLQAPLATTGAAWPAARARLEDGPLVDLIQRVQLERTGAQLSAAAALTDAGLPAGELRFSHVAALYPYENTLVSVEVTGAQLRAYLEHSARYFAPFRPGGAAVAEGARGYNFDMIAGAHYILDLRREPGQRVVELLYAGKPVEDTDVFSMAINSYRQRGGGGYTMLANARVLYDRQENIRELVADYLRTQGQIEPADVFEANWSLAPGVAIDAATLRYHGAP